MMWINNKPVLHIVDTETSFQNLILLQDKTAQNLLIDFVKYWATIYTVFPETIRLYHESSFASAQFIKSAYEVCIHLKLGYIKAHNSIGQDECITIRYE